MSRTLDHTYFMKLAIRAARQAPQRPFGTVIADPETDRVVCEGWNRSLSNPTWHGEIDAINRLAELPSRDTNSLILYTTAEPCVMCQGAILWTGIGTVVFGTSARTLKQLGWKQFDLSAADVVAKSFFPACRIHAGVLETECDRLFADAPRK